MEVSQRVDNGEARAMEEKARGVFLGRNGEKMREFENWTNSKV